MIPRHHRRELHLSPAASAGAWGPVLAGETTRSFSAASGASGENPFRREGASRWRSWAISRCSGCSGRGAWVRCIGRGRLSLDRHGRVEDSARVVCGRCRVRQSLPARGARRGQTQPPESRASVYTSGQADGCHYIAMELVEGETLAAMAAGAAPLPSVGGAAHYAWTWRVPWSVAGSARNSFIAISSRAISFSRWRAR